MKDNILLLHGALGSKKQLASLETHLSQKFNTYSFNFDGHGGKASDSNLTMIGFAQNILDFLKENNIEKTHIFGYSMGGYAALTLAQKHPDKVQSIVTLGTKFDWTEETAAREVKMLNPEVIEQKVPKFAQKLKETHAPNDWKELLNKTAEMMLGLGAGNRLSNEDLNEIRTPVLICLGSLDKMVSKEESEEVANQLKGSQFKFIEGFYHPIEKNDSNQLAEIVSSFIDQ